MNLSFARLTMKQPRIALRAVRAKLAAHHVAVFWRLAFIHREGCSGLIRGLIPLSLWLVLANTSLAWADDSRACAKAASTFLGTPDSATLAGVSAADRTECWKAIAGTNENLGRLLDSVAQGNRWSAEYLSRNLGTLDGGNLEDAYISLGLFSERRMEVILSYNKIGLMTRGELASALTMLPNELADDQQGQLRRMESRRTEVATCKAQGLDEQKRFALRTVDQFMSEISASVESVPK